MFTNHLSLQDLLAFVSNPNTPKWHTVTKKQTSEQERGRKPENAHVFDLGESNGEFTYEVELPGFSKDQIKVKHLADSIKYISVTASRKTGEVTVQKAASFQIPRLADPKSVKASVVDGILTIKIAKLKPEVKKDMSFEIPIS